MKLTTTGLCAAIVFTASLVASAQTLLIDFGSNNAANGGYLTVSDLSNGPDSNGNYWNNLFVNGSTLNNMVFSDNSSSGISMAAPGTLVGAAGGGWGIGNGTVNLSSPNLNIFTAYTDGIYQFAAGGSNTLTFSGLNPSKTYNFSIFGSRADGGANRVTRYTVAGSGGSSSQTLTTSGPNIGGAGIHFNNSQTANFSGIQPNGSNEITVTMSVESGTAWHLNTLEITVVPEPTTNALLILAALAGSWVFLRRRTEAAI